MLAELDELPAHPDVLPAGRLLAGAGIPLACLTNGSAAVTAAFVRRAGAGPHIERVISVAEIGTWKPPAAVYRHAAAALGVPTGVGWRWSPLTPGTATGPAGPSC